MEREHFLMGGQSLLCSKKIRTVSATSPCSKSTCICARLVPKIWKGRWNHLTHWGFRHQWKHPLIPTQTLGGWINIKMSSYQYRKSHCGDKTILRPSYLHNGISYTDKMTSLYWIRALVITVPADVIWHHLWPCSTRVHVSYWIIRINCKYRTPFRNGKK